MLTLDDLTSIGTLGLLGAINTYDDTLGVPFRPYAIRRIFGQMVDAVRELDPVPHPTRSTLRKSDRASEIARQKHSPLLTPGASEGSIAHELGIARDQLGKLRERAANMPQPRHIDERVAGDDADPLTLGDTIPGGQDPLEHLLNAEAERDTRNRLAAQLTIRELEVVSLHHGDGLDIKEIAERLELGGMETLALLLAAEQKLGAKTEDGRPDPITPQRKGPTHA